MKAKGETCDVNEGLRRCGDPVLAKGMCSKHYQRVYRSGTTEKRSSGAPKSALRLEVEEKIDNYRGRDMYHDIPLKFDEDDRQKVKYIMWCILRKPKRAG